MGSMIAGCGVGMPDGELDSAELARRLDIEHSWILERTGIGSRRVAGPQQSTSTLAIDACSAALDDAGVRAEDVDLIIVATSSPDDQLPPVAPLVQRAIGAGRAGAFDLNAGCAGFLYAIAVADSMIGSGSARRVLVCGSDVLHRFIDHADKKSCVLFGDGAGAVLLEGTPGSGRLGPFRLQADGAGAGLLGIPSESRLIKMEGREVYRWAVETMTRSVQDVLGDSELTPDDVTLLVGHQANARILTAVADRLGLLERTFMNIDRWGNTSAASIPIALAEASDAGILQEDDVVVLTAFGSGFVWGSGVVRWGTQPLDARVPSLAEVAHA